MSIFGSNKKILGELKNLVTVPYVEGNSILAFLHTGYYHVHGASFIYPDKAAPITLTSGAGVWNLTGNKTEIIPVNTIIKNFDLHWVSISAISAILDGVIDFYSGLAGAEILIGSVDVLRSATSSREMAMPIMIPQQPANTRISARLSTDNAGAQSCKIKVYGHVYSTSLT